MERDDEGLEGQELAAGVFEEEHALDERDMDHDPRSRITWVPCFTTLLTQTTFSISLFLTEKLGKPVLLKILLRIKTRFL